MSRIGKKPIPVPAGVNVNISTGKIEIKGPLGTVAQEFPASIKIEFDEEQKMLNVSRPNDNKRSKVFQGLTRALVANGVTGVSTGFSKSLSIVGTGYNAKLKGKHLELQIGFCLPISMMIPTGITVEVPAPTSIVIKGSNKQQVGQFAANVRAIRPPEPYKGKGIRYRDEVVKIKASRTVGAGAG